MQLTQQGILLSNPNSAPFDDVVMIIGDSIAFGSGLAAGPTPAPETVWQWPQGAGFATPVGSNDLTDVINGGSPGSQWPSWGIEYYNLTGRKACFVDCALGGSRVFDSSNQSMSWYHNVLWPAAVAKTKACLSRYGRSKPDLVYIHAGTNDIVGNFGTNYNHFTSLIDKIISEFGSGQRIIFNIVGFDSTYGMSEGQLDRFYAVKRWIWQLSLDYANVEVGASLTTYIIWGAIDSATLFKPDGVHLNTTGNDVFGKAGAYQFSLPASLHKGARYVAANLYDRPNSTRLSAADVFFKAIDSAGYMNDMDSFGLLSDAGGSVKNMAVDWFGRGFFNPREGYISDSDGITFNGTTGYMTAGPPYGVALYANLSSDYLDFDYIDSISGSGSLVIMSGIFYNTNNPNAYYIKSRNASNFFGASGFNQAPPGMVLSSTTPSGGHLYTGGRDGGNVVVYEDSTLLASEARTYVGITGSKYQSIGVAAMISSGGSASNFMAAKYGYRGICKRSGVDLSTLKTICDTLRNSWS